MTIQEIAAGMTRSAKRLAFYREVMGLGTDAVLPDGAQALALAAGVMELFGQIPATLVRQRLGALQVAADSRVRAVSASQGQGLRRGTGEVTLRQREQGYAGFFGVEIAHLTHRRFDGGMSPVLRREAFVIGDAVTVLPYDPKRDRVLLIEQMRVGPLGRGDPLPWQIEAIAGRIDPGETPEDSARREAMEEAGLSLGRLEKVGEYYPSPGAVTEYLYSYIAICDLPDGIAGLFGATDEAEDIRGFLLSRVDLMAALARGEIGNAPLMLSALWLDREWLRLRGDAR